MNLSLYRQKLTTVEKAVRSVRDGDLLMYSPTMAEPPALLSATATQLRSGSLDKIRVFSALPLKHSLETILAEDLYDSIDFLTYFVSSGERDLVRKGIHHYFPCHFHEVPRVVSEHMDVDIVMLTVSPMDNQGYFSYGTENTFISTAARLGKVLIVEVNRYMPRVFHDAPLHVSDVDFIVENHQPLMVIPPTESSREDIAIGKIIAEMIPDEATIQLGLGNLPSAVASFLEHHKNLGIHTEVFCPALVLLIKKGVVNGSKKTLHPYKHTFTVAIGDREMLDFIDDNPTVYSFPVSYNNNPWVIAQNDKMISINSVIEVDLFGQCNAESLEGHQFSGAGGQVDYVRGAYASKGGKSILSFHSTAKQGTISRIVPRLREGASVTTSRMDTHWLVTENGAANLKGKCTRDRALTIIELAHPDFQEDLLQAAKDMKIV